MTTPHAERHPVLPRPACTPAAIRAVLAANADAGVLQSYDHELDAASSGLARTATWRPCCRR